MTKGKHMNTSLNYFLSRLIDDHGLGIFFFSDGYFPHRAPPPTLTRAIFPGDAPTIYHKHTPTVAFIWKILQLKKNISAI